MSNIGGSHEAGEDERIVLGLLETVERNGAQSQRMLASELGVALGLVNAYLKRCIKKGLVKVQEAPARRYVYYLTPKGFAEKSKLTVDYLSYSFSFFRQARSDCAQILAMAKERGVCRIVLAGQSDLADIIRICALECNIDVVAIVDANAARADTPGLSVVPTFEAVAQSYDAVVITDLQNSQARYSEAVRVRGAGRVYVPKLLGLVTRYVPA